MNDKPAGFWVRAVANFVDSLFLFCVYFLTVATAYAISGTAGSFGIGIILIVASFYAPAMIAWHNGSTFGKAAVNVEVVNMDGQPTGFGRAFARELTKFVFVITTIMTIVDALVLAAHSEKRSLHDLICGTRVIRSSQVPEGTFIPPMAPDKDRAIRQAHAAKRQGVES